MMPNTDPVHQVTIIPRGRAGGFTMILPKEDKYYSTKTMMMEQIVHLLGGRVAEKLTLNDISTGASNDIERATEIARGMVTKYGFSERLGPVNYSSSDEVFLGKDFSTRKNYSEEMASEIDEEIRTIIEDAYATAEKLLTENIDKLHTVAQTLLEIETLDGEQFEALFTGAKTSKQLIEEVHHMERAIEEANALEAAQDLEDDEAEEMEDENSEAENEYAVEEDEEDQEPEAKADPEEENNHRENTPEERK
jgi:cell division protease FtsH